MRLSSSSYHLKHTITLIMNYKTIQIPSVFLPRVSAYHDEAFIEQVFWFVFQTQESPIDHIDLIMKQDQTKKDCYYHIAFVFFKALPETELLVRFTNDIESGKRVKMVHSDPWYWNMSKNIGSKKSHKQARILSEADEQEIKQAQKILMESRINNGEIA